MENAFLNYRKLPNGKRCAVALLIRKRRASTTNLEAAYDSKSSYEVLFIRRAMRPGDHWAGDVAFPGGWRKKDECDLDTMIRESYEEIGIDIRKCFVHLGNVDDIKLMGWKTLIMACGVFMEVSGDYEIQINPSEVADYLWVPIEETVQRKYFVEREYTMPTPYNFKVRFPAVSLRAQGVEVEWGYLWGLTHMVFGDFMKRLGHPEILDERYKLKYSLKRKFISFLISIRGLGKILKSKL